MEKDMDPLSTQVREDDYREGSNIRDVIANEIGKAIVPDSSTIVREFTKWMDDMDFRLLTAMLDEAKLGKRVDGSWTTQAYSNIVESLRQSGLIGITKNNVKNRQKSIKDIWREVHDLFSGLSGFAWDESTKCFTTEYGMT
ncbi:hypothetical protein Fmac_032536 [Flemingia macrophylla]|uniref:Myb/SANT-like domain-containing protein n=1 Tax=Flemingia macrophylla TaxID=520843 RepID=A0ABD1L564_9FABA